MFFVLTTLPMNTAATTNTSRPKTAVFQWLALQRPMRAAMLFERFSGDMRGLLRNGDLSRLAAGGARRSGAGLCLGVRIAVLRACSRGSLTDAGASIRDDPEA